MDQHFFPLPEHQDILVESSWATCSLPQFPLCKRILLICLEGVC